MPEKRGIIQVFQFQLGKETVHNRNT